MPGPTRLRVGLGLGIDGSEDRVHPSSRPPGKDDDLLGVLHLQRLGLRCRQRPPAQEEPLRPRQTHLQLRRRGDGLERIPGELCHWFVEAVSE